jgi:hypothetical protein
MLLMSPRFEEAERRRAMIGGRDAFPDSDLVSAIEGGVNLLK